MPVPPVSTPCVKICVVDPVSTLCIGCGRSVDEIAAWTGLSERDRLEVMAGLETRLVAMRSRSARSGRAGRRGGVG
jgi:predicted Fe-S protein YdhL (DUF1289 family)